MHHGIKKLLLLGAGHAHLHVLARLAQHRPADLDVTVLTPDPHQISSGMVPGFVAGRHSLQECQIPLEPLIRAAGAKWVPGSCSALDVSQRKVQVAATGHGAPAELAYQFLSIDTGGVIDRQRLDTEMPGAAEHGLLVRPMESFTAQWPEVLEQARQRALSVAVIGSGAGGLELLFAAEQSLRRHASAGVCFTLITGGGEPAADYPAGLRARVLRRLRRLNITVLRDTCAGIRPGVVRLGSGTELACDVPILAIGTHAPAWLQGSGLALDATGHVLVNPFQQSTSHPDVFAAGDVATRIDQPQPRSAASALRAGQPLADNLLAANSGQALKPHHPPKRTLHLISCGAGHALASWGPLHAEGGWAWYWKQRLERRRQVRYAAPSV